MMYSDVLFIKKLSSLFFRQFRLVGYRFCLDWLMKGKKLGHKNRRALPACVVVKIREAFPAPDEQYAGFQWNRLETI